MPQLDKVTFNHQLTIITFCLFFIYFFLGLVLMPKIFAVRYTRRKLFLFLSRNNVKYLASNFFNKKKFDQIYLFLFENIDEFFYYKIKNLEKFTEDVPEVLILKSVIFNHFRK